MFFIVGSATVTLKSIKLQTTKEPSILRLSQNMVDKVFFASCLLSHRNFNASAEANPAAGRARAKIRSTTLTVIAVPIAMQSCLCEMQVAIIRFGS